MALSDTKQAEEAHFTSVELLDFWFSPYAMRVKLAFAAKGVPYTSIPQDLRPDSKSPLLLQSNPVYKKVPVLLHNHKPVCESLIICQYVDEAFPAPTSLAHGKKQLHDLLPTDPYLKATARFWADFVDKKVTDTLVKLIQVPREQFGGVIQEMKGYLQTVEERAFQNAPDLPFFGGADLGLVDVVMGPLVVMLPAFEIAVGEEEDVFGVRKLPRLQAWLKTFGDLPLVAQTILCTPAQVAEALKGLRKIRFPHEN